MQASIKIDDPSLQNLILECGGQTLPEERGRFYWEGIDETGHDRILQSLVAGADSQRIVYLIRWQRNVCRFNAALQGARTGAIPAARFQNLQPQILRKLIQMRLSEHPDMLQQVMEHFDARSIELLELVQPCWNVKIDTGRFQYILTLAFSADMIDG